MAWKEFKKSKTKKAEVKIFNKNYRENILQLYLELKNKTYQHSGYYSFYVNDPKLRRIHKACVKDRILHHAIFRILYPIFDKSFIFDSYSCRLNKGTHRAVNRLQEFARKASKNNSRVCFVLKCDIKKFFDSIDQNILVNLICNKISDEDTIWLLNKIIGSYLTLPEKGIPMGNITSQLFANIYLDKFDQFVKHKLKIKYYIRYCDDFLILSNDILYLQRLISKIAIFLNKALLLSLHPNKIIIKKYRQGIDFLGYVCFPYNRVLRTKTKNRMLRRLSKSIDGLESYRGMLKHCNSYKLTNKIINVI